MYRMYKMPKVIKICIYETRTVEETTLCILSFSAILMESSPYSRTQVFTIPKSSILKLAFNSSFYRRLCIFFYAMLAIFIPPLT